MGVIRRLRRPQNERNLMLFLSVMMIIGGASYVGGAVAWWLIGRPWMAATNLLYALSFLTLYFAGLAS